MCLKRFIAPLGKRWSGTGVQTQDSSAEERIISRRLRELMEITNPVLIETSSAADGSDGRAECKET